MSKNEEGEEHMPLLMTVYKGRGERPAIQILEDEAALQHVYRDVIAAAKEGEEILAFGAIEHFSKYFPNETKLWLRILKNPLLRAREILDTPNTKENTYLTTVRKNNNSYHLIRTIREGKLANDNIIYGNRIAIFSYTDRLSAVIITSKEIVATYRTLFYLAWETAEDVK